MKFTKIKKLHTEYHSELDRLSKLLSDKFSREIIVTPTTDGLCVIFEDEDATGVTLDDFEKMMKEPYFDTRLIRTIL